MPQAAARPGHGRHRRRGRAPGGVRRCLPAPQRSCGRAGRLRCHRNPRGLTSCSRRRDPRSSGLPSSRADPAAPSPALSAAPPCSAGDAPPSCMLTLWRHVRPEVPAPLLGPREAFIGERRRGAWPRGRGQRGGVSCAPALTRGPPCCRLMRRRLSPAPGRVRVCPFPGPAVLALFSPSSF